MPGQPLAGHAEQCYPPAIPSSPQTGQPECAVPTLRYRVQCRGSTIAATVGETTGVGTGDARGTVVVGSGAAPEWDRLPKAGVIPNVERASYH